jgi:hypothetical protein
MPEQFDLAFKTKPSDLPFYSFSLRPVSGNEADKIKPGSLQYSAGSDKKGMILNGVQAPGNKQNKSVIAS